jgi:hypothetical protein
MMPPRKREFDARPINLEINYRANRLLDSDLSKYKSDTYGMAPDMRVSDVSYQYFSAFKNPYSSQLIRNIRGSPQVYYNYSEAEVANLKQRIVRAEASRDELTLELAKVSGIAVSNSLPPESL